MNQHKIPVHHLNLRDKAGKLDVIEEAVPSDLMIDLQIEALSGLEALTIEGNPYHRETNIYVGEDGKAWVRAKKSLADLKVRLVTCSESTQLRLTAKDKHWMEHCGVGFIALACVEGDDVSNGCPDGVIEALERDAAATMKRKGLFYASGHDCLVYAADALCVELSRVDGSDNIAVQVVEGGVALSDEQLFRSEASYCYHSITDWFERGSRALAMDVLEIHNNITRIGIPKEVNVLEFGMDAEILRRVDPALTAFDRSKIKGYDYDSLLWAVTSREDSIVEVAEKICSAKDVEPLKAQLKELLDLYDKARIERVPNIQRFRLLDRVESGWLV